ncbi:sigma-70 family RNA polymerase sigma factor [Rossellomorea sp. SC111]|uniref:RNA polymerase sigma factor n=1 Tax=Rossellomorea sp. SC111 TaxID=2968985 RepID=UPI00215A241E|nr:sigma-70 family RNA polymerase sigma factor [Rossellomorea sp. SC111]MCR8848422.1 sigma-70 family RNA polymerase sigma factor [Rossellomorea sp. SC111]
MNIEERWIKKIKKSGSHEAANELISRYYREMYSFVYKQTIDSELSYDLTQEIFISALKSIGNFDPKRASFRTWLYKVASNRVVDYFRSRHYQYRKLTEQLEESDLEEKEGFVIRLEYQEEVEQIAETVSKLDAGIQQIVRLKLFGEYTLKEIGNLLELPLSTVKTRYYAGIKLIKKEMKVNQYD